MSPLMSIALRRTTGTASTLFPRVFANPATVLRLTPSVYRSFNTDTHMTNYDDRDRSADAANRSISLGCDSVPSFFHRRGWDVREDENALLLRMDMPGLGKGDVRVSVEQNTLTVKGEESKEADDEEDGGRRFSSRLDIPSNLYKLDLIRAEMKNGLLKIMVPKVKQEERKDVFQVKVDLNS